MNIVTFLGHLLANVVNCFRVRNIRASVQCAMHVFLCGFTCYDCTISDMSFCEHFFRQFCYCVLKGTQSKYLYLSFRTHICKSSVAVLVGKGITCVCMHVHVLVCMYVNTSVGTKESC
jgi:hypothetical protein